jgi:hypothetical protein
MFKKHKKTEMFGIDIEESPQIGLVDISEKEGIWWGIQILNLLLIIT